VVKLGAIISYLSLEYPGYGFGKFGDEIRPVFAVYIFADD